MSTDLSAFFAQDDAVFELPIKGKDPETGEEVDTGVVFQVRSLKNPDALATVKRSRDKMFGERMLSKSEPDPEKIGRLWFAEVGTDPIDEQLATCVVSWDWGGKSFGKISTEYTQENVTKVISSAPWIRQQVLQKVLSITDFTKA